MLLVGQVFVTQLARQVEAHLEQSNQLTRDVGVVEQRAGDIAQIEAHADLLEIARIGPQQRDLPPGQPCRQDQAVEGIVLGETAIDVDEGVLQRLVDLQQIDFQAFGIGEGEIMDPVVAAAAVTQLERKLTEHAQAQVLHDRQDVRQRQRRIQVVKLAMQAVLFRGDRLVETHHQRTLFAQIEHMLHVDGGRLRREALAIAGREALGELAEQVRALRFAEALDHQALVIVLPGTAGLQHFLLETRRIDLQRSAGVQAQNELHPGQYGFGEIGGELAVARLEPLLQNLLDLQSRLGGIAVARHVDQAVAEASVRIEAQEQPQAIALLDLHDGDGIFEQLVDGRLEQLVARQHFQNLHQLLGQVRRVAEVGAPYHRLDLAPDEGDAPHALGVDRRGEQTEEAALAHHSALFVEFAHRDEVRISRAVHTAGHRRLGERQQKRLAQIADRLAGKRLLLLRQPGAHAAREPQQRILVIDDLTAVALLQHGELLVTEKGEVVIGQPAQEVTDLVQLIGINAQVDLLQPRLQVAYLAFHGREVTHHLTHVGQHTEQRLLQLAQGRSAGAAVDLDEDQRFGVAVRGALVLGQQLQQCAVGCAAHLQDTGLQGVDAVTAAGQLHAHRVDQERHVRMQHLDHAVGGLPAMLFIIGIEDLHFRHGGVEALEQPPAGQRRANQVAHAPLGQLGQGDDAEELFGEQFKLGQDFRVYVLGQRCLQLLLKVGLAGR